MSSLTIIASDFQKIASNISDSKGTIKENDQDFSKILEDKKNDESSLIKNHSDKTKVDKEEKVKELNIENNEKHHKPKDELKEEALSIFSSVYELILHLSSSPEEFNEMDWETINDGIKQLSIALEALLNQSYPTITKEDHKNLLEIFDTVEKLGLLAENKAELDIEKMKEEFKILEGTFAEIDIVPKSIQPIVPSDIQSNIQNMNQNPTSPQDEEVFHDLEQGQVEKVDADNVSNMKKEIPKKDELSAENILGTEDETTTENVELHTTSSSLFYQTESKTILKSEPAIENSNFEDIDKDMVFDQIVEKAKLIIDDNKQEIRIKLKPEILGELILKMEMEEGTLLAKALVDNYRTKDLIEANLYQFKEEMKENGLEIKTFEVFVGTNEDFERESRREFTFNKKPSKLRIKNKDSIGMKVYEEAPTGTIQGNYHDGQLNLFA